MSSQEVLDFRAEREAERRLEDVRKLAEWHTGEEIRSAAQKKYIPTLYVPRAIESEVHRFLPSEDTLWRSLLDQRDELRAHQTTISELLSQKIAQLRKLHAVALKREPVLERKDIPHLEKKIARLASTYRAAIVDTSGMKIGKTKDIEFRKGHEAAQKQLQKKKEELSQAKRRLREIPLAIAALSSVDRPIDELLEETLESRRPGDPVHRDTFVSLARFLRAFNENPPLSDGRLFESALSEITRCSKSMLLIVDRAGGGKTNLLCHVALAQAKCAPTLFLTGKTPIEKPRDLFLEIVKRLGLADSANIENAIDALGTQFSLARSHLTIIIDGINECRNVQLLNQSLNYVTNKLRSFRVRFLVSCRDIYWTFFRDSKWARDTLRLEGSLYEYSDIEHDVAIEKYLNHFNLKVHLKSRARERCRHPLLLRFFCEAYGSPEGELVDRGPVEDIRLKPLFDDYWKSKFANLAAHHHGTSITTPEHCLRQIAAHFFDTGKGTLLTGDFRKVTGSSDVLSDRSPYIHLLDEDIIFEELPTSDGTARKISFVYEEFMEYAIARELFRHRVEPDRCSTKELFQQCQKKRRAFVNVLGVCEYMCAFCLDERLYRKAFDLAARMASAGEPWTAIMANVFQKNDNTVEMILSIDADDLLTHYKSIRMLVIALKQQSRDLAIDVCVALGWRILLPSVLAAGDIVRESPPPITQIGAILESHKEAAAESLSTIARVIVDVEVNTKRKSLWGDYKNASRVRRWVNVGMIDVRGIVRGLWELTAVAPRRDMLRVFCCNGLFSGDRTIRSVVAWLTAQESSEKIKRLRKRALELETDREIITFLR